MVRACTPKWRFACLREAASAKAGGPYIWFFLSSPKQIIFSATCHIAVFPLLDPLGRGVKFRSGSTLRLLVSNKDNFHNIIFEIDRRINFGMVKLILIKAFSKDKNPDRTILKNLGKVLRVEAKPILSRAASL